MSFQTSVKITEKLAVARWSQSPFGSDVFSDLEHPEGVLRQRAGLNRLSALMSFQTLASDIREMAEGSIGLNRLSALMSFQTRARQVISLL